jgi:mono/diheme cytochrome c family protein
MNRRTWIAAVGLLIVVIVWFVLRPPRFWLNIANTVEPSTAVGSTLVESHACRDCHRIGGTGALKAPSLDGLVSLERVSDPALTMTRLWLRNPRAVQGSTAMPNFRLSDREIDAIILYLDSLTK